MPVWENAASDKCSNCGANIFFDENFQKLTCKSCGSFFDPHTKAFDYQLEIKDKNEASADDSRVEFQCNSCGAIVVTDSNTSADICAFCGSPSLIKNRLRNEFQPDVIIPFKISKEDAEKRFKKWASEFKKAPRSFSSGGAVNKMQGIYVPFWLIDAECHLDYNEQYVHMQEYDFTLKEVPFDGSSSIPDGLMRAIEPFNYDELVPYADGYLHGFKAKRYDESAISMSDKIYKRLDKYVEKVYENSIQVHTNEFRNENYSFVGDLKQKYALLPVWFLLYDYEDHQYQYVINGQTGEIQGFEVPYSKLHYGKEYTKKILTAVGAGVLTLAICGLFLAIAWNILSSVKFLWDNPEDSELFLIIFVAIAMIGYGIWKFIKKMILGKAQDEIEKPVYHLIDNAPEVEQYFDTTSIKKTPKKQKWG